MDMEAPCEASQRTNADADEDGAVRRTGDEDEVVRIIELSLCRRMSTWCGEAGAAETAAAQQGNSNQDAEN
jgi:hypothetical protein